MGLFHWPKLRHRDSNRVATIDEAISILGKDHVCGHREVYKIYDMPCRAEPKPLFLVSTLEMCAKQNADKRQLMEWYLVYAVGFALMSLFQRFGSDLLKQPCFFKHQLWEEGLEPWLHTTCESGYWLINFKPRLTQKSFDLQQRELVGYGAEYERVPENVLVETLFLLYLEKGKRFLETDFHCGDYARIGKFSANGIFVLSTNMQELRCCRKDAGVIMNINPLTAQRILTESLET
jgi:hypothetical protein